MRCELMIKTKVTMLMYGDKCVQIVHMKNEKKVGKEPKVDQAKQPHAARSSWAR